MYIPARNASRLVDVRAFAERAIPRDLTYLSSLIPSITCSRWVGLQRGIYTQDYPVGYGRAIASVSAVISRQYRSFLRTNLLGSLYLQ